MSTTRRIYFYAVTIITLGIFAAGIRNLLSLIFDITVKGSMAVVGVAFVKQQLSLSLAMIIIAGPLWYWFWRSVQRYATGNETETGAAVRKLFLNLVLMAMSLVALFTGRNFLIWLMAGLPQAEFSPSGIATFIVAGLVGTYHWHISEEEGHPSGAAKTLRRWYVYILSGWSLVWLATAVVQIAVVLLRSLPVWDNIIVAGQFWNNSTRNNLATIAFGAGFWVFHWLRMAKNDFDSTLRQVYLYLLAILNSAIAGLVAFATILYWLFNRAFSGTNNFQFLTWTIPTLLVATAIWNYHEHLAMEEASEVSERRFSAQRIHLYLMSLVGLGTMIAGIIALIGILLDLLINAVSTGPITVASGWWHSQLSLSLSLLLVGTPLWLNYWNRILRRTAEGTAIEWAARSRRVYLYLVTAAAIVTLAADLVNIVYQALNGLLQTTGITEILKNSKWSFQSLFIAAPVLVYHLRTLRRDLHRGAEAVAAHKSVTVLASNTAQDLVMQIEDRLGFGVHLLSALQQEEAPVLSDEELTKLASDIQAAPGPKVMLVVAGGKIIVIPYEGK
ncbi:MAG: hypothetical protein HYX81_05505 [Chloroflexi bacterium]|nr:hypothetical protein [Chloroflexota bacterium]